MGEVTSSKRITCLGSCRSLLRGRTADQGQGQVIVSDDALITYNIM